MFVSQKVPVTHSAGALCQSDVDLDESEWITVPVRAISRPLFPHPADKTHTLPE